SSYYNCLYIKENLERNIKNSQIKLFGSLSSLFKNKNTKKSSISCNEVALLFDTSDKKACTNVFGKRSVVLNLNLCETLSEQIVKFEPDLVINDLNHTFACISYLLGLRQWYVSPLNVLFNLKYSSIYKRFDYWCSKFPPPDKYINYHILDEDVN